MLFHFRNKFPELDIVLNKYAVFQKRVAVNAKTILLEEGSISKKYIFIEKGCVRLFFNNNGTDKTVQFFFENEGLTSFDSFTNNTPSQFTIETIEPSVLLIIDKEHVLRLIDELMQEPKFAKLVLQASSFRQLHYTNEFVSFIRDTPEQRYQNLLKERPHIIQRVPQHYIASYLGISSVHLSRIKRKLAKGEPHF